MIFRLGSRTTATPFQTLLLLLAAFSQPTCAFEFTLGKNQDIKGIWDTSLLYATAWRMQDRNPALYNPANGNQQGLPAGRGGNSDDGNLNYSKGDNVMSVAMLFSTLDLSKDGFGGRVRVAAWYDWTQNQQGAPHGNQGNNYVAGQRLSDRGFEDLARFDGVALLDAYGYGNWMVGEAKVQARIGRQVVNWGTALVLQGVDQINPLDVNILRRPGTLIANALIPVGMAFGQVQFSDGPVVEAFYQFEWQSSVVEGCGTYFSASDGQIGPDAGSSGCASGVINAPDSIGYPARQFISSLPSATPPGTGQYGISLRQRVDSLDSEFALYVMNIHARVPNLNGIRGAVPFQAQEDATGLPSTKARWVYPENIRIFGVSAATKAAGWALTTELSYTPNLPVQLAGGDIVAGQLYSTLGIPSAFWGPLGPRIQATPVGGEFAGYDRGNKTMLIANAFKVFPNIMGAQGLLVAGEVASSWSGGLDNSLRYGRPFLFGIARSPSYGPLNEAVAGGCPLLNTPNQPGCEPDGFYTSFAWGYRLKAEMTYANVFDSGITVSPNAFWLHDVKGYSVDNQINQGRQTAGLGVRFGLPKQKTTLGLLYAWYADTAQWVSTRDRDYFGVAMSVAF